MSGRAVGDGTVGDETVGGGAVGDETVGGGAVGGGAVGDETVGGGAVGGGAVGDETVGGGAVGGGAVGDETVGGGAVGRWVVRLWVVGRWVVGRWVAGRRCQRPSEAGDHRAASEELSRWSPQAKPLCFLLASHSEEALDLHISPNTGSLVPPPQLNPRTETHDNGILNLVDRGSWLVVMWLVMIWLVGIRNQTAWSNQGLEAYLTIRL